LLFEEIVMERVYITRCSKFLPNEAISNDQMESFLGMINGKPSVARRLVLNRNKISSRYYALDREGRATHSNADMTVLAIQSLFDQGFSVEDIELLSCGTTSPDQLLPSHAAMVHGLLGHRNMELSSLSGACCSGMQAMKYGFMSVGSGNSANAVCAGSERISSWLKSGKYDAEAEKISRLEQNGFVAFEKEFLRWMLSDGAGCVLLENKPGPGISLQMEWLEITSFAHRIETCMYAGAEKQQDGSLKGWHEVEPSLWLDQSLFSLQQDIKLLGCNIVELGQEFLNQLIVKHQLDISGIDYFLPHLSSEFFKVRIMDALERAGTPIPAEKWFTNLTKVGNVGAASPFLMLEELFHSGRLKKGEKLLLMVPESARFSYSYCLLTVC
jgi:3-oxoacyl-[acyl-carrier-protein] synthase-3